MLVTVPVLWLWPCCSSLSHGCHTACPLPTETPVTVSETLSSVTSEYIPPPNRGGLTFCGSQILKGTAFSPAQHHGSIMSIASPPPHCSAGGHRATGEKMEAQKVICPQKQCDFVTSSTTATSQDPQVCLHHSHYFPGNPLNPSLSSSWATYATVWANMTGPREPRCYRGLCLPAGVLPEYLLHLPCVQQTWPLTLLPCPTSRYCTCPLSTLPPTTLHT